MNEEIKQAIASLERLVECHCDEAYTVRGWHDPHNACDCADEVKIVVDHIEDLNAKLDQAKAALREIKSVECIHCTDFFHELADAVLDEQIGETK